MKLKFTKFSGFHKFGIIFILTVLFLTSYLKLSKGTMMLLCFVYKNMVNADMILL